MTIFLEIAALLFVVDDVNFLGSPASFSILISSPTETSYCLPPVSITANSTIFAAFTVVALTATAVFFVFSVVSIVPTILHDISGKASGGRCSRAIDFKNRLATIILLRVRYRSIVASQARDLRIVPNYRKRSADKSYDCFLYFCKEIVGNASHFVKPPHSPASL